MLKKWVICTCVIILLIVVGLLVFWRQSAHDISETAAPVIVTQAEVTSQGVRVTWLEAQLNHATLHGYTIERSRSSSDFSQIARVEKGSLQYLDAEGHNGDRYRVVAESSQRSKPSEPITAAPPKPGSNVVIASLPASRVLGSATLPDQTSAPTDQATSLKSAIDATFVRLEAMVADRSFTEAASHLHALQSYQRESLLLLPRLSSAEKSSLAQSCAKHAADFEAILHMLPEGSQLDGMLVEAGCDALQEAAL